jgi:protein SCO1
MNRFTLWPALLLAACTAPVSPPPLAGAKIGGPFALTDQSGTAVTDRSYAGRYRIMYFGYTYCPDVCPTDVANLARGLKTFAKSDPSRAARVVLIFVSVDPARDTPAALKAFTSAFDPKMVGLTGSAKAVEEVSKAYGVAFSVPPGQPKDGYIVDHSRVAYLMDPENKPLALVPQDGTAEEIAREVGKWVK